MADIGITKFRVQIPRNGATPSTPGFAQSEGQDPVNPPGSPTGIYVPYLGATGAVNLGEFGLTTGNLKFDLTPTNIPTDQGTMYWRDSRSTLAFIMNGTTQHIGQDQFIYVKNSSGSPIAKGVAVRNSGTDGGSGHILIEPMLANGTNASETFLGVTAEAIANGGFGQVMAFGELAGINTSTYTAGAFLYVSTTVAGQFQTTAPVAPNNIILVGRAINSKNNGDIFIRPHIGSNINNDEGVKITSPTTGDLLQIQAGGLWENRTIDGAGIVSKSGNQTITGIKTFSNKIVANGSTNSASGLDVGTLRFQHFGTNNAFIAENTFYNGTAFQRINTGLASVFYLSSGGFQVGTLPSGNAGTTQALLDNRLQLANDGKMIVADNVTSGQISFIESAILAANSTTRGFLTPRMSSTQRNSILTPATGLEVFQTTNNSKSVYNGSVWADVLTTSNYDGLNIAFGTGTGTKIGTATTQKIGFWNATPIIQPTTAIAESTFVENAGGTVVNEDSTFDGYTLRQVVKALRDAGLLA